MPTHAESFAPPKDGSGAYVQFTGDIHHTRHPSVPSPTTLTLITTSAGSPHGLVELRGGRIPNALPHQYSVLLNRQITAPGQVSDVFSGPIPRYVWIACPGGVAGATSLSFTVKLEAS